MDAVRKQELRAMLEERRRELGYEVVQKRRNIRASSLQRSGNIRDTIEEADADVQEDIDLILIQRKAETLQRINEALERLEQGTYGNCPDCGGEIAWYRLLALPFAVRCKGCEDAYELAEQREQLASHRQSFGLFFTPDPK